MNVLIVGLGGIGGFLGAKLAGAYASGEPHRVFFLARGSHLNAILERGLTLKSHGNEILARPFSASQDVSQWPPMDLILLCVKGYDLGAALNSISSVVTPSTWILPLQNGIGKRALVERAYPTAMVADGAIYVFAHIESPGVILHVGGPGRVVFGRQPSEQDALSPYLDLLLGASIQAELVPTADVEVWGKFVVLAAIAGTTALYGETVGRIMADPDKAALVEGLMAEVVALGKASGVPLPPDLLSRSLDIARGFPPEGKSSLLHDLEAGRPSELDWLLGTAVGLGQRLGVDVPLLEMVYHGIGSRWLGRKDPSPPEEAQGT